MLLKQSTARNRVVLLIDSADHVTGKTGLTPTIKSSKNGAAFATITPTVTELEAGFYKLALTTGHTDTLGDLALHITGTGADPTDVVDQVVVDLPGVAQTGDAYARIGAPSGASIAEDVASVQADTNDIQTRIPAALVSGRMDSSTGAMAANVLTATAINADAITAAKLAADVTTELQTGLATASALSDGVTDIRSDINALSNNVGTPATTTIADDIAAILADTNDLQTDWVDGGRLDLILDARASQTSVDDLPTNAELATALGTADDAVLAQVALVKAVTDKVDDTLEDDAGTFRFTANALEQAPTGGAAPTAADVADAVWDELLSGHVVSGSSGEALAGAGAAGDPWTTALPGAYGAGTAGKIVGDNINAAISSRATQASVDDVPTNAELATALGTADGAVLTQVALVKAKTDLIPAAPAATGDIVSAAAVADAVWDETTAGHAGAGSTGEALTNAGGAGTPPTVGQIADEVQTRTIAAVTTVGSVTADVGITQGGADKVWTSAARTLTSFGALVADTTTAVWSAATRLLTAGTNIVLDKGTGVTGFNDLDASGVRSAVGLASANLDTQLDALPTNAELAAADDAVLVQVALVKAKTDNLPADPADASDVAAQIAAIAAAPSAAVVASAVRTELTTELGRVDVAVSTRLAGASYTAPDNAGIAAIEAQAALIPAAPAAVGDIPTSAQNADKLLGRNIAGGSDGGRIVTDAFRSSRNRVTIIGGFITVYAEDDTTVAWTGTVATAPGNPLSAIDPV